MYECPNCGGNLKFEISSQKLYCAYCDTRLDPYAVTRETDALEGGLYETNAFICPQCGGQMLSGDNDATAFCSYCGAANILSSRIVREKRPKYIIPFQKTKEDCKKAYAKKMQKAFFVPKEYKDAAFIDGFRGIYMPYWNYRFSQQGELSLDGKIQESKGDYINTSYYKLRGELDAVYEGCPFDASSGFYDNISQALAPFDAAGEVDFTPSYLSGFYAEVADVEADVYAAEARILVNENTYEAIKEEKTFRKYEVQEHCSDAKLTEFLHTKSEGEDSVLYPVWFMSYRNGDRVAYAVVNGQTGKVVADMPLDVKKYLLTSLALAVPVFFLLNLFLTLRPIVLITVCAVLQMIVSLIYYSELGEISRRETFADDKAVLIKTKKRRSKKPLKKDNSTNEDNALAGGIILILFVSVILSFCVGLKTEWLGILYMGVLLGISVLIFIQGRKKYRKLKDLRGGFGLVSAVVTTAVGLVLHLWKPVSDLWYYGGVWLILLSVIFLITDVIRNYNRLAMRKLPQFEKKGGDDNA